MIKKTLCTVLACIMLVGTVLALLCSCSPNMGQTLMKIENNTVSVNMLEFYLTRAKGYMANYLTLKYGSPNSDKFWDEIIDLEGTTNNMQYTLDVANELKQRLCGLYIFDKEGYTLPQSYIDSVDKDLSEMLEYHAGGSRSKFNSILSQYGVNYDILREIYIMEAKYEYLRSLRASHVSDSAKSEYYEKNFVRYKQIYIANYEYICKTDQNGDVIYYTEDGKICYDKTAGTASNRLDKNGDIIYVKADGRISYNTKDGVVQYETDKDGNRKIRERSEEECESALEKLAEVSKLVEGGNTELFETYISQLSEDATGLGYFKNGCYLDNNHNYTVELGAGYAVLETIKKDVNSMEIGDTTLISDENSGYYLVMKYELDENAFSNKDNSSWFAAISSDIAQMLLEKEIAKYYDKVEIDEELLKTLDIKSVSYTNYYY